MGLPARIETLEDAENFVHYLLLEERLNFHPDTPFSDYICSADGSPTYTPEQCAERERLLDRCFAIAGDGIYAIGLELQFELLGLPSPLREDYAL
jgi:hypothetical protein